MKMANDDKVSSRHLQLPLGFSKTDPGDLKRVLAFLDDCSSSEPPVSLSKVFSRFSGPPDAWSGARIARIISSLFSDRMISCAVNGNVFLHHHSTVFLETPDQWERIQVVPRKRLGDSELEAIFDTCRNVLGRNVLDQRIFDTDFPPDQDDLIHVLGNCLKQWKALLAGFDRLAETGQYPGATDIRSCISFIRAWLAIPDPYEKICFIRDGKAALVSFSQTVVRLKNFYENWIVRWESWRKSLDKFTEFQPEIEADMEAAAGLSRLRHVLSLQSPWEDLDGMEALIARIKQVYDRIRDEKFTRLQRDTLLQINRMIETISGLLENVHARDEVRNLALVELQTIRKAIEIERPGGLISKQREIAEEAFEKAQDIVLSRG